MCLLVRALLLSDDPAFRVRVGATVAGKIGSWFGNWSAVKSVPLFHHLRCSSVDFRSQTHAPL